MNSTFKERMETRVERGQIKEDRIMGAIERRTSMAPSILFLGLALGSMAISAILKVSGKNSWALFVGQWAAPFLIMGNYNKMVKQHGSDATSLLRSSIAEYASLYPNLHARQLENEESQSCITISRS
jgi:hypothetical protein